MPGGDNAYRAEPVNYDDDCRYGGNVCHSDVPCICRSPAHAPTRAPPARTAPTKMLSIAPCAKLRQIKLRQLVLKYR